jgi:acyl-CoA thioesterase
VAGVFDRDTAVWRIDGRGAGSGGSGPDSDGADSGSTVPAGTVPAGADSGVASRESSATLYEAQISPEWRAGRGPHGGYLAAILLRALTETVADPTRAPRSLTIHYARAPQPGQVTIHTVVERAGRSLSTLSARMEQDGKLMALALAAFSVPWGAVEIAELPLPDVAPPDAERAPAKPLHPAAPRFLGKLVVQPRLGAIPFSGADAPMEVGAWLGLREPRPLDALALAMFSDALFSPPFIRLAEPAITPTIDLTIHFRQSLPDGAERDLEELCFARFRSTVVHDGFFEEDGVIWAADGTVLAQSRQLAIVLPFDPSHAGSASGSDPAGS